MQQIEMSLKNHDISVWWKVRERVGDLHTDRNNIEHNSKLFNFPFVFLAFYTFYWLTSIKYFIKSPNNLQVEQLQSLHV